MTLKELVQSYTFHDSGLLGIEFLSDSKSIKMEVNFCNWAQDDYTEDLPEIQIVYFIFHQVSYFDDGGLLVGENDPSCYDFLDEKLLNDNGKEGIEFTMYHSKLKQGKFMRIFAHDVEWIRGEAT